MSTIRVSAGGGYEIRIRRGQLADCGAEVRAVVGGESVMLVTDETVAALYGAGVADSLAASGYAVHRHVIPAGEPSKNGREFLRLLEHCAEAQLTRSDAVVALGGGVVGDLAGFAAATYLRGVKLVQIPTTLLAMVDSSVGGKTAIDLAAGKNLAGAFYQPSLVLCDPNTLATLPADTLADGLAETLKYGMLCAPALLETLTPSSDMEPVIADCVAIKRDMVDEDERDIGARQLLNLGHTVGHAIEALSGYAIPHGRAVAAGMAIVTRAAEAQGDCEPGTSARLETALCRCGLPTDTAFSLGAMTEVMLRDKKRSGSSITLIVPHAVGRCERKTLPVSALAEYLRPGL